MRVNELRPEFVEYIPEKLSAGVLYVSDRFRTCSHLCCCGCGEEVVTPLSPAEWELTLNDGTASLWPSIGNWDYACRSHYIIVENQVSWAKQMSPRQIAAVKRRDAVDLSRMIIEVNIERDVSSRKRMPWWKKLWIFLVG